MARTLNTHPPCHKLANTRQILGLLTILIGIVALVLHVIFRRRLSLAEPQVAEKGTAVVASGDRLSTVRMAVNQLFLVFIGVTSILGFTSLSSVSICATSVVPLDLAVLLALVFFGAFILGSAASIVEAAVIFRDWRRKAKSNTKEMVISNPM